MDVKEAILNRRSIRSFQDIPIQRDILTDILQAGQYAPSAGNLQTWKFIIVDDESQKELVAEACYEQTWIAEAPVVIVIFMSKPKMEDFYGDRSEMYTHQSAACAAQNMMTMASAHGLGSCMVSAMNEEKMIQIFGEPWEFKGFVPYVVLPIGYAAEKVPVPAKVDLTTIATRNWFGGRGRVTNDFFLFNDLRGSVSHSVKGIKKGLKGTLNQIKKRSKKKNAKK